jgi:GGDEF domain-containing protein
LSVDPLADAAGSDVAAAARAEWREEEDEWTRAAFERWQHARRLVDALKDVMYRGDAVLVEIGRRLPATVRPADTVARIGGDEFVVVCERADESAVLALADRLLEAISVPIVVDGRELGLSASIGIALGSEDPEALLGSADAAGYRAKAEGRGRAVLYR